MASALAPASRILPCVVALTSWVDEINPSLPKLLSVLKFYHSNRDPNTHSVQMNYIINFTPEISLPFLFLFSLFTISDCALLIFPIIWQHINAYNAKGLERWLSS